VPSIDARDGGRVTIVLVAAVALWARNTWILLGFMVPLFGWLPVTAPVWVYPALMASRRW
jgi:hypothetical protein